MKTIPVRIIISLVAVAMVVALYSAVHADSISFGTPYWVTSNWSNSTSPPRGAQASPNNDGIACPGGSVQTGWRIIVASANGSSQAGWKIIYTSWNDAYAPEGSGGGYDSYEYGTQCRPISSTVIPPPPQ